MEWDNEQLRVIRRTLAELYPRDKDRTKLLQDAGLRAADFDFEGSADDVFFDIVRRVKNMGKLDAFLDHVLASEVGAGATTLRALRDGRAAAIVEGPTTFRWNGTLNTSQLEKILGDRNTLVPVRYLRLGADRAAAVARIALGDGGNGTGFLLPGGLLMTNHHVLASVESARAATAIFDHEETRPGIVGTSERVRFDPDRFFKTSVDDDWTAVALGAELSPARVPIPVAPRTTAKGALVNIIQHPGGGVKMVSVEPRIVAYVGEGRLQYLTDTQPGSSGSPVFDLEWNLVALHHSGGWIREPGGGSREWFRNEGILVERFLSAVTGA